MTKTLRNRLVPGVRLAARAAIVALQAAFTAAPAHADPCDDVAKELADQIEGLKVNFRAANIVYLTHPAAKELSLGCRGQNYSNELYAKGDRKLKPEFLALVGRAAALVFTVPKDDSTTGTTRCLKRMGVLRGDKVSMRYRRLNMECTRSKTEAAIAITRGKDDGFACRCRSRRPRFDQFVMKSEPRSPFDGIGGNRAIERSGFINRSLQPGQGRRQRKRMLMSIAECQCAGADRAPQSSAPQPPPTRRLTRTPAPDGTRIPAADGVGRRRPDRERGSTSLA